ncbi:DeoR/GlpR family DNA-binding transcription regulator [Clostridium sp. SHJSY1]|uniref:DeoR/GlpR family DNA-binding transcription regulator n=1 Tax=Clostridium sp. SHJSY1 TaxID=2942483 RepID=UPI00287633D3|nr:DeoR/GlpR family DNA-binding transcription regulator [Clostridium sp. SHJSY1]MDS0526402.1 DeoR/GlpR family DNA-binding transcription regulator [Clostridium sp. SHJSY1]
MKKSNSLVSKRQQLIFQDLKDNGTVKIDDLSKKLEVSPITIRRDLQIFEKNGIVEKFYGGAKLISKELDNDPSFNDSSEEYLSLKHSIAKRAAELIEDGDIIFINSSSTALLILEYLEDKHVTIVTNNGKALQLPLSPNIDLILTGGEVSKKKLCMVGDYATQLLSKITADKCFLGVSGISANLGISTCVLQETTINSMMLKKCNGPTIILADNSKIGKNHNFLVGEINRISYLVTDSNADEKEIKQIENKGIKVLKVNSSNDKQQNTVF